MSAKIDPFKSVTVRSYTAKRFLQKLDETHERWGGRPIDWIFRGQNDARWELMPSLFRPENWDKDTYPSYEIDLIDNFISNVNLMNLPIPNHSLDYIMDNKRNTKMWLGNEELSDGIEYDFSHIVFAIAQHSGVPTRLLDFTYSPLVAAYFAANVAQLYGKLGLSIENKAEYFDKCIEIIKDSKRDSKGNMNDLILETFKDYARGYKANLGKLLQGELPQNIAVWAIRYNDLRETTIRLLEHPYTEILNLRLQMGVFLCDTEDYESKGNPWRSFDAELAKLVESKGIYKFTLPFSQRAELLNLLVKKRINSAYLTPSYEQVAKAALGITKKSNKEDE